MQEQPELVGGGLGTRGAVGGEMGLPGLDMVLRLPTPTVELLVEGTSTAVAKVGDDEAAIGAVAAGLDAGDDPANPAPAAGGVEEFLEAADLAVARVGPEACCGARLQTADVTLPCAGRGRTGSQSRSPNTSRAPPGRRSGCRLAPGSPPAASCRGSLAPGGARVG